MKKLYAIMVAALLASAGAECRADVIGLKTNKAVGETFELALNGGITARFAWSDGSTDDYTADGLPHAITVKADSLTITTTAGTIKRLYAPAAGLVSLNVAGAPDLEKLFVAGNAISTLQLEGNKKLREVDVAGNSLAVLNLRSGSNLVNLNVANNRLTDLSYNNPAGLEALVVANNDLDTLTYVGSMRRLETLWAQNNHLRAFNFAYNRNLKGLMLGKNELVKLEMPAAAMLAEMWVDQNRLTALDLSKGSPALQRLVVQNNPDLSTITWDKASSKSLESFYAANCRLFFNSFPTVNAKVTAELTPQNPYRLTGNIVVDEQQDWTATTYRNPFGQNLSIQIKAVDATGYELERGTGKDFIFSMGKWTFFKQFQGVTLTITSPRYDIGALTVQPFDVTDATGITAPSTRGLNITAAAGTLTVEATAATTVRAFDAAGRAVISATVGAGSHTWSLQPGVYVVNGKKILVPNL